MAIVQSRPRRKPTGARYRDFRKKRKSELGKLPAFTKLGKKRLKKIRTLGGNQKFRLLGIDTANLFNPGTKSFAQAKITNIYGNPANRHFVRRNIITKGTLIDTDKGKARVTSRPGQDGIVNAILIS